MTRHRIGPMEVMPLKREVTLRGEPVIVVGIEYRLLRVLMQAPTRVFTKQELIRELWGDRAMGKLRELDATAEKLQRKLRRDGDRFVDHVWGVGYRLVDGDPAHGEAAK